MHINLETNEPNSIQAYTDKEIKIDSVSYQTNLIVSRAEIINDWSVNSIQQLDEASLAPLLQYQPKIVIIGHNQQGKFPPMTTMQKLSKMRIGLECMSIGAACRTYNVLLGEQREVVLGIIF